MTKHDGGLTELYLFIIAATGLWTCMYLYKCVVELQGIRDALQ